MTRPSRSLILFLLAVTAARLLAAAIIPLSEDEAYYRLWAQTLQLGYVDHPPMIAWWVRAGMTIAGDDPLGVRLLPALSSGLASYVIFDVASRLGATRRTAVRAAVWFNAMLLIGVGGILAIPDAPNILFWSLTLACLVRTGGPRAGAWWAAAGVAAGLATLSKYSALFIAPGVGLWLLLKPGGWRTLLTPWPWIAGAIACALFGLNVAWNAEHHWVTFAKQFGRVGASHLAPQNAAVFIAGQFVLLNPSIAWFLGRTAWRTWRRGGPKPELDVSLPLNIAAPFVAYLLLHGLHDRVEAHWTAPLYPGLAIVAALGAESAAGYLQGLRARAAPIGLAVCALILLHLAWPATDVFGPDDPAIGFRGWPAFATRVEALRVASGARWVGVLSYGTDAQLSASGRIKAPIVELRERDRYPPADRSWWADLSKPGLVIDLDDRVRDAKLGGCVALTTPIETLVRGDPGKAGASYTAVLVHGAPLDGDCGGGGTASQ